MYQDEAGFDRSFGEDCSIATPLAKRLRDSRASLSLRWLERIVARVNVGAEEVFPTQDLLDHVPMLIEAMADHLENPAEAGPAAERVIAKAAELGQMRYEQGFSPYQILKEFELLGGIVLSYLSRVADDMPSDCPPGEFMVCAQRLHRALALIQQATTARYLAMLETRASEREQRLRAVNELLGGPLRARLQETIASARDLNIADPERWTSELRAQLEVLNSAIDQVEMLSFIQSSARMQRNVPLKAAIAEAVRNLRDASAEQGVEISIPEELPDIEVNAAAVELAVMVFLTTMLRHGEMRGAQRRIELRALGGGTGQESVVQVSVCDSGAVLPEIVLHAMDGTRAPDDTVSEDSPPGIGLAVARETIESLGGRVALRLDRAAATTEFVLELPSRRAVDQ